MASKKLDGIESMIDTNSNEIAIIGYNGFVGGFINERIPHSDNYNSSNINQIKNKSYRKIYFAGLPAQKWLINKNPEKDWHNIQSIIENLNYVKCDSFILFSTIDVYDKNNSEQKTEEPYGKHRYFFEQYVRSNFHNHTIIRLPALFGIGLKKNIIYDVLHNNQLKNINIEVNFQWYDMHFLWSDLSNLGVGTYDFFSDQINTKNLLKKCFGEEKVDSLSKNKFDNNNLSYLIQSHDKSFGSTEIEKKLSDYLIVEKFRLENNLSISCISWKKEDEHKMPFILKRYGIKKVEIAPTRYFEWTDDAKKIKEKINHFSSNGIEIYSMQSLFYGINVNLFEDRQKFIDHILRIIDISLILGCKRLVYGSPKTRKNNNLNFGDIFFIDLFSEISEMLDKTEIVLCIEPNSRLYGCNYLYNFSQVANDVKKINKPNIKINFDTGNALMEQDEENEILNYLDQICHVHLSNKNLSVIENVLYENVIRKLISHTAVNIEMKDIDYYKISDVIYNTILQIYGEQKN